MIRRRATVGLFLLCALVFCAFAAQSAWAAAGNNTTAFTCVDVQPGTGPFEDEHCDKTHPSGKGNFAHKELESKIGQTTKIIATNAKTANQTKDSTPTVLKAEPFKVKTEISCEGVNGTGTLGNTEPLTNVHKVSAKVTITHTKCTVLKPAKCTIKEPFETVAEVEGVEGLGAGKNEMGVEFKPESGKSFGSITLEGAECVLNAKSFNIEGSAIATSGGESQAAKHHGATWVFTAAMTKETLKAAEKPAEVTAVLTIRMHPTDNGTEKPIALTTIT